MGIHRAKIGFDSSRLVGPFALDGITFETKCKSLCRHISNLMIELQDLLAERENFTQMLKKEHVKLIYSINHYNANSV